jgi:hypothetical protein
MLRLLIFFGGIVATIMMVSALGAALIVLALDIIEDFRDE